MNTTTPLTTVPQDIHYPILPKKEQKALTNASFVHDNGVAVYVKHIQRALQESVASAFGTFRSQKVDKRGNCCQEKKWLVKVSDMFRFLGFIIDTHVMTIACPGGKIFFNELIQLIRTRKVKRKPLTIKPSKMIQLIESIRLVFKVPPWGNYLSFNLDNALTKLNIKGNPKSKIWWEKHRIIVPRSAEATIHQVLKTFCDDGLWTRPIALYFLMDCMHTILRDVSYVGVGSGVLIPNIYGKSQEQIFFVLGFT